jgi:hypothetical protein
MTSVDANPRIINPGEVSFLYENTIIEGVSENAVLKAVPHLNPKAVKIESERFPVTDVKITKDKNDNLKVIGRVENTSDEEQMIRVVIQIWDKNGNPYYLASTILTGVKAGEKIGFEARSNALPPQVNADSAGSFKAYAYPHFQIQ